MWKVPKSLEEKGSGWSKSPPSMSAGGQTEALDNPAWLAPVLLVTVPKATSADRRPSGKGYVSLQRRPSHPV